MIADAVGRIHQGDSGIVSLHHPDDASWLFIKLGGTTSQTSYRLLTGDVSQAVAKLKVQEGDEIQVLGSGKRLFERGALPRSFRRVDTQLNTTGAVLHVYERAGRLRYGEVEVGQETVIFDPDAAHE